MIERKQKPEHEKYIKLMMDGHEEDILTYKDPIKLHDAFKKSDEQPNMRVVFEGGPGAGKTALTLHLCKEWADGNMFKNYKLVILVQLREPNIHNAKEVKDILPHVGMEEEASKEMGSNCGTGVLFVLDGWDEQPAEYQKNGTICKIISREQPECDIVITSRPTS